MTIDDVPSDMDGRGRIAAAIPDIDAAGDEQELRAAVDGARAGVAAELNIRTPALAMAAAWSEAMRRAVAAGARLVGDGRPVGWTWFVSGSVARGEAVPGSDIETLVALDDAVDDAGKIEALAMAADVHALLERCGVRPDANGVLASRGRFCRRRANWSASIDHWCAEPATDRGVVMTGLLADATAVFGGADGLRAQTIAAAQRHPVVRQAMLQDATFLRATIPSRLRVFATHDDTVELKIAAIDPVVKIARWGVLSAGSAAISTLDRLSGTATVLDPEDASILRDCYTSLARIRWQVRARAWVNGERMTDRVSLSELAPVERATLRTVAREIAGVGRKLNFLSSTSSFR